MLTRSQTRLGLTLAATVIGGTAMSGTASAESTRPPTKPPVSTTTATPKPATTPTVTRYVPSTGSVWLYDSPASTHKVTGLARGGDAVTGTFSNGWLKVTSGTYAGQWLYNTSATPTKKPVSTNVKRYIGVAQDTWGFWGPSQKQIPNRSKPANRLAAVTGDYYADGSFQVRSSGNNVYTGDWLKGTLSSNPYNSYETQQWQDTGVHAEAAVANTVTRYAVALRTTVRAHSSMSYATKTVNAQIPTGSSLSGHYVNSHWFLVTSGPYAGKYVSSGELYTTSSLSSVNGRLTSGDLCAVPSALRYSQNVHDRYLGCEAVQQLVKLSNATSVLEWEGYRDYATQVDYYNRFGFPRAAVPGTSNHGLGNAIDLHYSSAATTFSTPQIINFSNRGPDFGWTKPYYLTATGNNPEPWHFEFTG